MIASKPGRASQGMYADAGRREGRSAAPGRRRVLKGQLVFEFVIATLFFLAIVMYMITYTTSSVFAYTSSHEMNTLESRTWQISEAVLTRQGSWSGGVPQEIGLALDWPVLSNTRINDLDSWCGSNEQRFLELLDVDSRYNGARLEIVEFRDPGEFTLLQCGSVPYEKQSASITRFAASQVGTLLKVTVSYW